MSYDVQKIREIAYRLGVPQKTVIQYIRGHSLLECEKWQATQERPVPPAEPESPVKRPSAGIMPGHLHG